MKLQHWFMICLIFISLPVYADSSSFQAGCVGVSDGDTIKVLRNNSEIKIRLEGIDCPELHQAFSRKAKQFTSAMVFGKTVTINVKTTDKYGRTVARVIINGKDVSLELVKAGLAWHFKRYSSDPVLAKAEEEARAKKIGLWANRNPLPPWEWRHIEKGN